ncbi:MAG: methyltransferase, partial [Ktedonobacteraceae bacterium]
TLPEYLEAAGAAGFELEQDEEINAQVSEFWIHSMAWTTAELDRAQSPIARDRLLESALAHGKMFRIWRDHAIETRLLLFRLCD